MVPKSGVKPKSKNEGKKRVTPIYKSWPQLGVRPKYKKRPLFSSFGLGKCLILSTRKNVNLNKHHNAIRPLLEEHAKKCYLTWQYIDMNDGKLPQDDLKTFDDWKQSSGCISTSVGSYPRMTYPSPTFHTTVFALSGVVIWRLWVDISRRVNVNTLTSRLCVTPSTPSHMTCSSAWLPTKHLVAHRRRRAPASVSPAICLVPRKCARVRAWKRILRRKIKFLMRLTRKMRQFKDV